MTSPAFRRARWRDTDREDPSKRSPVSWAHLSRLRSRVRRGSDSHLRHVLDGTVVIAAAPARRPAGTSTRETYQIPRPRKLSLEQEAAICAEASNRTLRDLAAAFEVSHETIRTVLRQKRSAAAELR